MFEKAMKIPDNRLLDYFVLTTDTLKSKAKEWIKKDIRKAHFIFASLLVEMYHDKESAENAKKRYLQVADGHAPLDMTEFMVDESELLLCDLLKRAGFANSNSEARRHIAGRGIKINDVTVEDPFLKLTVTEPFVLQFGKNKYVRIINNL